MDKGSVVGNADIDDFAGHQLMIFRQVNLHLARPKNLSAKRDPIFGACKTGMNKCNYTGSRKALATRRINLTGLPITGCMVECSGMYKVIRLGTLSSTVMIESKALTTSPCPAVMWVT
jgi:hypothetical protein